MQFPGKITKEDLTEARDLMMPKRYWPSASPLLWVLLNMLVLAGATLATTVAQHLGKGTHTNWWEVGLAWLGLAVATYFIVVLASKAARRRFAGIVADLPDWIDLGEEGVGFTGPRAAGYTRPWQDFKGWLEGKRVILLEWAEGGVPVILPLVGLPDNVKRELRHFLRAHIPAPTAGSPRPTAAFGPDRLA